MYRYKAFGLTIASDVALANLRGCDFSQPDVTICREASMRPEGEARTGRWDIREDLCVLEVPTVARFRMENGTCIHIEPCADASVNAVELYLMGSCMGAILLQRGIVPLHGSCVRIGDAGVLLAGQSGAGKSTVTAALLAKGARLITDDVAAVRLEGDGVPLVYPSYPSQKLWEDVIVRRNERERKQSLHRILNDIEKFNVDRQADYCDEATALRAVYVLAQGDTPNVTLTEITGMDKLAALAANTYRGFLVKALNLSGWHFKQIAGIADRVNVYGITRPSGEHAEEQIAGMILEGRKATV